MALIWYTNFETDQWAVNQSFDPPLWEYDHGIPRTTEHVSAAINSGRSGPGSRAIWLGDYNGDSTRNEVGVNRRTNYGEHWFGYSMYINEKPPASRPINQWRNMVPQGQAVSQGVVNPITLRQQGTGNNLYFALSTDPAEVDVVHASGASTGTQTYPPGGFSYNLNEWIDVVIHWKLAFGADYTGPSTATLTSKLGFDPRSDGFYEIWINGVKIVDHVGTTTYRYANNSGIEHDGDTTMTMGPYWASTNSPQGNIYYDEYKVWQGPGGTYEDVSPLGLSAVGQNDITPPVLSTLTVSQIREDSFLVDWEADEPINRYLEYGTSTGVYDKIIPITNNFTSTKQYRVGQSQKLLPGTTYYWRIKLEDAAGNITYTSEQTTTTLNKLMRNNRPQKFGNNRLGAGYVGSIKAIK